MQYSQLYLAEYGFTKKAQIMPGYLIYWHNVSYPKHHNLVKCSH